MKKLLPFLIVCSLIFFLAVPEAVASKPVVSTSCRVSAASGPLGFAVSKIEFRPDLTRIYGRLIGCPHTSGRIDALTVSLPGGKTMASTDIDGVDMKRYFQWEDENYIEVEIDFPPMKKPQTMTVSVVGPNGNSRWIIVNK